MRQLQGFRLDGECPIEIVRSQPGLACLSQDFGTHRCSYVGRHRWRESLEPSRALFEMLHANQRNSDAVKGAIAAAIVLSSEPSLESLLGVDRGELEASLILPGLIDVLRRKTLARQQYETAQRQQSVSHWSSHGLVPCFPALQSHLCYRFLASPLIARVATRRKWIVNPADNSDRLFCFGFGYVASALARAVTPQGWHCAGTSRSAANCARLEGLDIAAFQMDRDHPLTDCAEILASTTHILVSVPPDAAGDPVLDLHAGDIARHDGIEWIGYLSTTGVYGDWKGEWVDETTPLRPASERGRRRAAAEARWLELGRSAGVPVHAFRLAGIYGPGRSPIDQLRAGTARRIRKEGQVFGRIHVDDIVATLCASMAQPNPGAIYNLTDDEPAPSDEVVEFSAQLMGIDPPPLVPFDEAEMSAMARSFYAESKRVSNSRIKDELGVSLMYPNFRVGLQALL